MVSDWTWDTQYVGTLARTMKVSKYLGRKNSKCKGCGKDQQSLSLHLEQQDMRPEGRKEARA